MVLRMPGLIACIIDNLKEEPKDLIRCRLDFEGVGNEDVFKQLHFFLSHNGLVRGGALFVPPEPTRLDFFSIAF